MPRKIKILPQKQDNTDHLEKLPDDVILKIIEMLSFRDAVKIESLNKRFKQICTPKTTPIRNAIVSTSNQIREQRLQLQEHRLSGSNPSIASQVNTRVSMGLLLIIGSGYLLSNHSKLDSSRPYKSIAIFCIAIPSLYFYYLLSMRRCCSITNNSITYYSNFNQRSELTRLKEILKELFDTSITNRNNISEDQTAICISDEEPKSSYEQLEPTEHSNII